MEISLCAVAKNEAKNIADFVKSISPLVQEIIFVDTGSTDNTKELAEKLGCKVFVCEQKQGWIEEARNLALSKATKDWILALDLDERISPNDFPRIKELISNSEYTGYYLIQRQYINKIGIPGWKSGKEDSYPESKIASGWYENPILRLFKNDKRISYKGKPHDLVDESVKAIGKTCLTDIPIHHFGELNRDSTNKAERNLNFLMSSLEDSENKEKFYTLYQIACEFVAKNDLEKAEEYFLKSLELNSEYPESLFALASLYLKKKNLIQAEKFLIKSLKLKQTSDVYNNLGVLYSEKNELERAIKQFDKAIALNPSSADSHFNLGLVYLKKQKKNKAIEHFNKAIELNPAYKNRVSIA